MKLDTSQAGMRFDIFVASVFPECSRSLAADLIREGKIRVHDSVKKPGYRLKPGDEISGYIPDPEPVKFSPEPVELNILYEDEYIVVINKQPGLVVHPAPGHYTGTLVNGLLYHCPDLEGIGGKLRPGIVHRLDKNTSGTLVVAKNNTAHNLLSLQFKSREIKKEYLAIVHGNPEADSGMITLPIGRHKLERKKMSTTSTKAREAKTLWSVKERFEEAALLHINLKTGRTHQIRVHCAAIGHPVMGDDVYGSRKAKKDYKSLVTCNSSPVTGNMQHATCNMPLQRQMLHAWRIEFIHPGTNKPLSFESPIPQDMEELICALRAM